VVSALDAIERMLEAGDPQPEAVALCQRAFDEALASADRGSDWPSIAARAHGLSERLNAVTLVLSEKRDAIKQELSRQATGSRALKAYKPR